MKKILSLLVVLTLIFAMTGCSSKPDEPEKAADKPAEPSQAEAEATQTAPEDMTVGFIYVGPIGDGGYTYAHDQGRLYLEEKLGVKTIYKESVPETQEVEQEIRNMVDQGAKAIFTTSFGHMDYTEKMSKEFPDVAFFHCSGYKTTENMSNYFGRMYEARYLSGIVAGMKTQSNEIGYVAAFPIPEVIRGINAFTLGVQSVNPDAVVKVVWTSTWYDPAKEKEAAISLLDQGVDIIAQHQDTTGPQQAAEERGAFSIGYNTDMSTMAPKAYMTAPVWNWGPYYVAQVQNVLDGTFKSEAYWGGMKDDVVKLAPLTENAPAGAAEAVDAATAKILDGSLAVFAGPILNQAGEVAVEEGKTLTDEEMLNMMWFVKGVEGKIE
ncbi:BMP family ABC transporter substrate-binding protein [Fusibacter ferrireducens]|uniref:BMP family ABC transporter substrate-binding protein n=1 Tax=Fusibacter ferrireducens TaxID=2785058 RepID=A0ABR9ZN18_9FIRM|nr:BMP family ABC transporter substrate-binding protein [Fusibacter ferrireducens]MBF4691829.1 BMP family ABC transporter substrate-binding protein [Fusibacter ferrireducens]